MKSIYTIFLFIFLTILVFTGLNLVGEDIKDNSNLDAESVAYIQTLDSQLNNENNENYINYTNIDFHNARDFESKDIDAFSLQFQMGRTSAEQNANELNILEKSSNLFIYALGIESSDWTPYRTQFLWFLGILLAMIVAVLIFGPGRIFPTGGNA